jgi:hypothetical protein
MKNSKRNLKNFLASNEPSNFGRGPLLVSCMKKCRSCLYADHSHPIKNRMKLRDYNSWISYNKKNNLFVVFYTILSISLFLQNTYRHPFNPLIQDNKKTCFSLEYTNTKLGYLLSNFSPKSSINQIISNKFHITFVKCYKPLDQMAI